jgi:hypothetical protein
VVGMALLPERPCSLRPSSWAFVGAIVLEVIPEGFSTGLIIFGVIVLTVAVAPDNDRARSGAPYMGFVVAIFYLLVGLNLLRKAHVWARRAGPVQRLVPHARGRAYGFLAAVLCQLGITIALLQPY